jgi:hypothetical protein
MFNSKGLEFLDIVITEVHLPEEIRTPLDLKAQFGSLNEMEREKYNFDMRIINDNEELELLSQRKYEQRDSINEDFSKTLTFEQRELEVIRANAEKSVAEIKVVADAEQAQIIAEAELKNEKIKGDTLVIKWRDTTLGEVESKKIAVEAKNTCNIQISAKMLEIADLKSETL